MLKRPGALLLIAFVALLGFAAGPAAAEAFDEHRHAVTPDHPRLLGSLEELRQLAEQRPQRYQRVRHVAGNADADDHSRMISMALVSAIDDDAELGRGAVELALEYVDGPVRSGHVPYGGDLARCAIVFDLCYDHWTADERERFVAYVNATADANVESHQHVFHNGWWGYKHWGIGLAAYATYHENDRATQLLADLERDYRERAAPALQLAGDGGGWAEGYYIHYWLYEWLFFCEVARRVEGVDYHAEAPEFYQQRAVASMFEMYPGMSDYNSRRPIPMGDGGGRRFGADRDKVLTARRILVSRYRDDPAHQAVHTYNEQTPRVSVGNYAYKDFLWRDTSIEAGDLETFRLAHLSPGPGHVYARSGWGDDAAYFFFKATDRFTAHQHLDVGHFLIYRHGELAGKGGHYDAFGSDHDVNFHLRTLAHNTILVHDPDEQWPAIRAGNLTVNDGGQHHDWPHHNGGVTDPQQWQADRDLYDIADLLAFEDRGDYLYLAADGTRAYSPQKLERFTRQIVYLRPGTFVIFDEVRATQPDFDKTWLLHAMTPPQQDGRRLRIDNGDGRLFVQTLLPAEATTHIAAGDALYEVDGERYPPAADTGPAPQARIEVSPDEPARTHYFLHVLTATDADAPAPASADVEVDDQQIAVTLEDGTHITFTRDTPGGAIRINGARRELADTANAP